MEDKPNYLSIPHGKYLARSVIFSRSNYSNSLYLEKKNYAKHFYVKRAKDYPHAPSWEQLDLRIRDVVVDIFFQGIRHPASLIDAAIEGRVSLISFIRGNAALMRYESSRHRIRYLQ